MSNPYLNKKRPSEAPPILRVPMHDFESGEAVETDLLPEELCICRIPNITSDLGYTHHVALTYKSKEGEVMSLTMAQHHGETKPGTLEELQKKSGEEPKDPLPKVSMFRKVFGGSK
jgi:hypothetical protein